jgi:hypothetical protein
MDGIGLNKDRRWWSAAGQAAVASVIATVGDQANAGSQSLAATATAETSQPRSSANFAAHRPNGTAEEISNRIPAIL